MSYTLILSVWKHLDVTEYIYNCIMYIQTNKSCGIGVMKNTRCSPGNSFVFQFWWFLCVQDIWNRLFKVILHCLELHQVLLRVCMCESLGWCCEVTGMIMLFSALRIQLLSLKWRRLQTLYYWRHHSLTQPNQVTADVVSSHRLYQV